MKPVRSALLAFLVSAFTLSALAADPAPPEPASAALLDHFYREIQKWDSGAPTTPGISPVMSQALRESDFMSTRNQIRQLGAKAWPLSPRVADLLQRTERNQYNLAWMLTEMTPDSPATAETVVALKAKYRSSTSSDRFVALAQLGKTRHPSVASVLKSTATADDPLVRLMSYIALANAGQFDPDAAATALATGLTDKERYGRLAAVNSLRLLGAKAHAAGPALAEYLKTRDNVFQATAALKAMSLAHLRPLKPELESILADPKLTEFQKRDTVEILIRLEAEK